MILGLGYNHGQRPTAVPAGVAEGPLAWWKHNEGSGETLGDSAGSNHGTITNGGNFWTVNGPDGNPVGKYVPSDTPMVACGGGVGLSATMSIVAMVYFDSVVEAVNRCILCKRDLNSPWAANYKILRLTESGELRLTYSNADATAWHAWDTSDFGAAAATWYIVMFAFTFGTGASMKCYKNLVEVNGSWTSGDGSEATPGAQDKALRLGFDQKAVHYMAGRMGDVLIYDKVLSTVEREDTYAALKGRVLLS